MSNFLVLGISHSTQGIFISQKKYTRDLLKEAGVLNNKPYKTPLDPNVKLQAERGLFYLIQKSIEGLLLS